MNVKVSPKYQVVIPRSVRETLKIKPGTKVNVIAKGNAAYIVPVLTLKEVQSILRGKLDLKNIRDKKKQ